MTRITLNLARTLKKLLRKISGNVRVIIKDDLPKDFNIDSLKMLVNLYQGNFSKM